jgi:hypothetical protein
MNTKSIIKKGVRDIRRSSGEARIDAVAGITEELMTYLHTVSTKRASKQVVQAAVREVGRAGEVIAAHYIPFLEDEHGNPWVLHRDWLRQIVVQTIAGSQKWERAMMVEFLNQVGWSADQYLHPQWGDDTMTYDVTWRDEGTGEENTICILLQSAGVIPAGSRWISGSGIEWIVTSVEGAMVYVERYDEKRGWVADRYGRRVVLSWKRVRG